MPQGRSRARLKALNPKRAAKRLAARSEIVCARSGESILNAARSSRRFCSAACRQAEYRSKASAV
jgi:hypothetical protein